MSSRDDDLLEKRRELEALVDDFARYVWGLSGHNFEEATHHQYIHGRVLWLDLKLKPYLAQAKKEGAIEELEGLILPMNGLAYNGATWYRTGDISKMIVTAIDQLKQVPQS